MLFPMLQESFNWLLTDKTEIGCAFQSRFLANRKHLNVSLVQVDLLLTEYQCDAILIWSRRRLESLNSHPSVIEQKEMRTNMSSKLNGGFTYNMVWYHSADFSVSLTATTIWSMDSIVGVNIVYQVVKKKSKEKNSNILYTLNGRRI